MPSTMRLLFGGVITLLLAQPATAGFVFVSNAYFVDGNEPRTSGSGLFTVEQAPIGSGSPLVTPANLADGFATGRGFVIRYVASAADLGGSVFINWTADRDYQASGGLAAPTIQIGFTIELVNSQGANARVFYEATTIDRLVGPSSGVVVFDPGFTFTLSPDDATKIVSQQATGTSFALTTSGLDSLRQNFLISLTPTQAGQEFRIHLSSDVGVSSTLSARAVTSVPGPSSLILSLTGLLIIGVVRSKSRRGRQPQEVAVDTCA